jgi:hypothetical protein
VSIGLKMGDIRADYGRGGHSMNMRWVVIAALLVSGCNMTNRSFVRDTLATLPSGEVIAAEAEVVQQWGGATQSSSMVVWRRQTAGERLLTVAGHGEMRVKDAGKVLEVKGDIKDWNKLHGNTPAAMRVSADGNRAWLVSQGQVVASFDYDSGVAVFGTTGQPVWATGAQ